MNYIDKSEELLLNIEDTYSELERIIEIPGIKRKRKISHALPCEKAITMLIANLLKNKKYHYTMDCAFDKNDKWQPDLIIKDKNNNIIAVIETKYQIGYWNYQKDIERLQKYQDYNIIFVNLLESNHSKKIKEVIEAFSKTKMNFYTLYNKKVHYNDINHFYKNEIFNDDKHGFIAFIKRISNL